MCETTQPVLPIFTFKGIAGSTAFCVLEAGVWTQVSYIPHWLFLTTMLLAAASIAVANIAPLLQRDEPRIVRHTTTAVQRAFLVSVLYAFTFAGGLRAPFNAEIRAMTNYVGDNPVGIFMVAYNSSHGPTVSPVPYLMYLQLVNEQDFESKIDSYTVELGNWRYLPWFWHSVNPISLRHPIYVSGVPHGGAQHPRSVYFPKGTYLLKGDSRGKEALKYARLLELTPSLDELLQNPLAPHHTIQGWAAFDRVPGFVDLKRCYFRFTIKDSAGAVSRTVVSVPLPVSGESDTTIANTQPTTTEADLSGYYLKFYGQP